MSHFTVIVIGSNIDEQLAPYTEQGFEAKYGVFEDTEEESLKEYNEDNIEIVVLADGSLHTKYSEQFRNYNNKSFSTEYVYPEDAIIRQGKFVELFPTFDDFMSKWHGNTERDPQTNRYGYWTNPNAKHDWYQMGGRWSGYFKTKAGKHGYNGEPGVFDNKPKDGWVDSIKVGDIDIKGMQQNAIDEASATYDKLDEILKGRPLPSWSAIYEKNDKNVEAARLEYNEIDTVKDLNKAKFYIMGDFAEVFGPNRESYVQRCKNQTMVPYAVVKEGIWYQKGEMGWFGMSSDEMSQDEWNTQFWEMIHSLPPETEVTLIDCHI